MLFLISPAKKLNFNSSERQQGLTTPLFQEQASELIHQLQQLSLADIQKLMDISPALAELNRQRYQDWSLEHPKEQAAALFAFAGDVYQGLDAHTLQPAALEWLEQHLLILSGLYGFLRPFDALQPYRLEMGSRLANSQGKNLYAFWSSRVTTWINEHSASNVLINCASEEYAKVLQRDALKKPCIDCVFQENKDGEYKVIGLYAKQARGRLLRFAAENQIHSPKDLQQFDWDGYHFNSNISNAQTYIFQRSKHESS